MRKIKVLIIKKAVEDLCIKANIEIRPDVEKALRRALKKETNRRAQKILQAIIENSHLAKKNQLAICQDTGLPVVWLKIGQKVNITGGNLNSAVQQAIANGYRKASLRNSIISDPFKRGDPKFSPAVIHTKIISGDKIKITVLPKGFGCENKSRVKMFLPTAPLKEVKEFIVETVRKSGPDACPPFVVGVGIGGTQDYACLLAKKALLKPIVPRPSSFVLRTKKLQQDLLQEINKLNIGPMGLGGRTTCLGVNIETYPTHIAGLPVAVNISCHALRSATAIV